MKISHLLCAVLSLSLMLICGCGASHQARSVKVQNAMLVNPEILKEGTGDQALYVYAKPGFDINKYSAIVVEPVLLAKVGEMGASEKENLQKLANNAYLYLVAELEKQIKVVKEPGKGVLDLQMAIHDADSSKPVRTITSTLLPIGLGLSVLKYAATGKPSAVGEVTTEVRLTDSVSGELLAAALDRRVGGKTVEIVWDTWHNADDAVKYWARRIGYLVCMQRKAAGCQQP